MDSKFSLNLTHHCIETEIKRLHNRLILKYLTYKQPDDDLEARITALHQALTHLDFARLRNTFPALSGGTDRQVVLEVHAHDSFRIFIGDEEIYTSAANG